MLPHIERLIAGGLRGLSSEQAVHFAIPSGEPGSGLTMLLGSNNSGKSTIIEALRLLGHRQKSSLSEGRRNRAYGDQVRLTVELTDGSARSLRSVRPDGSETAWEYSDPSPRIYSSFPLGAPSLRTSQAKGSKSWTIAATTQICGHRRR